jgi:WhiB family redox-sensing transcriptional regulator
VIRVTDSRSWWDLAACRQVDPEVFFPVSAIGPARIQLARAQAVCASCGVRKKCLEFALTTHEVHGVWGGTSEDERRKLLGRDHRSAMDLVSG